MWSAFVEFRDHKGQPIHRFMVSGCEEIGRNILDQQVYWDRKSDVSTLRGRVVRPYFRLRRAKF
jgi:hypothetical protein